MKRKHSLGWFSSYDRGLDVLLEILEEVKKEIPDFTLDVYYGWDVFDKFHSGNPERMKWKWQMIRKMHDLGVKEHGRVSHEELAKAMKEIQVWAYPTSFPEIDCITATKVQMAGIEPVTSGLAALQTSVMKDEPEIVDIHLKPKELQKFAKRLTYALKHPLSEADQAKGRAFAEQRAWDKIANQWSDTCESALSA